MSQQIQITGGAKVRNLEGVLTGTAGVVNALGINVPSGIPQLDGSGKILVSQLPNSVMEYKGTWNAATNTPTLANGTGNQGDVYLCNVAGTVNFGAGPIVFFVGDQVIYSGTIWQRASGSTGTVTSVSVTESGDALTITGSPITTSGTINIGFTGNSNQYVNGAGGLTTFPSLTGFVPYTGATANVDLGDYSIKVNGILAYGASGSGGLIAFKQTGTLAGVATGSAYIGSQGVNKLNIYFGDTGLESVILDNSLLSADRTFNFPDASGTLALLEGTQTFSGSKTFNLGIKAESGIFLKELSSSGRLAGYVGISTTATGGMQQLQFLYPVSGSSVFSLPTVGSYNYEFPAATGTIALTSNIPSITGLVPYTGATANVNLGTFDLTADVITGATGSFASNGGSNTFAINHSSGSGIALNITKGGNGEALVINKTSGSGNALSVTGTTLLTGALSGTSATFSGNVTLSSGGDNLTLARSGFTSWGFGVGTVSGINGLHIGAGASTYLSLNQSNGAATFSSSVTAGGGSLFNANNGTLSADILTIKGGGGTGAFGFRVEANNGQAIFRTNNFSYNVLMCENVGNVGIGTSSPSYKLDVGGASNTDSTARFFKTGEGTLLLGGNRSTSNCPFIGSLNAYDFALITNDTERMRITSGGDVGIGNSGFASTKLTTTGKSNTSSDFSFVANNSANSNLFLVRNDGAVSVVGSLSKGSGSFRIDHPLESMTETHHLIHSFVESPQANNIYRGKVQLVDGKAQVNLDEVSTMTEGTFEVLNREIHTYTSNETDWDAVRGKVEGNILTIECQNNQSNAIVSWLVIGERQDKHMIDTDWTDENGKVIVEPLKELKALIAAK